MSACAAAPVCLLLDKCLVAALVEKKTRHVQAPEGLLYPKAFTRS